MTATITSCLREFSGGDPDEPQRNEINDLRELTRQPWMLESGRTPIAVRPASVRDLPGVVQLHRRSSARSLLDRYRMGGRPPSPAVVDAELRNPYCYVAYTADATVLAVGAVRRDPLHGYNCAEVSLLVDEGWQRRGIGSSMLSHLAGVAQVAGFTELIAYPATAIPAAQRLMVDVGRTRMVPDANTHLHTYLPEAATLGLGSVRQRLAG